MADKSMKLNREFRWETLGDDVVCLDMSRNLVHRLSGPSAVVARHLMTGADHGFARSDFDLILTSFAEEGLLADNSAGMGRRDVIKLGIAGTIGLTTLMLPSAAAAASGSGTSTGSSTVTNFSGAPGDAYFTFTWTGV